MPKSTANKHIKDSHHTKGDLIFTHKKSDIPKHSNNRFQAPITARPVAKTHV